MTPHVTFDPETWVNYSLDAKVLRDHGGRPPTKCPMCFNLTEFMKAYCVPGFRATGINTAQVLLKSPASWDWAWGWGGGVINEIKEQ